MPQNFPDGEQKWDVRPQQLQTVRGERKQERKKERKKEKGTDMVVWDEMVVVEFGAGYWNMN